MEHFVGPIRYVRIPFFIASLNSQISENLACHSHPSTIELRTKTQNINPESISGMVRSMMKYISNSSSSNPILYSIPLLPGPFASTVTIFLQIISNAHVGNLSLVSNMRIQLKRNTYPFEIELYIYFTSHYTAYLELRVMHINKILKAFTQCTCLYICI